MRDFDVRAIPLRKDQSKAAAKAINVGFEEF